MNGLTFRQKKGAVKLHTLLDYDGCMPHFINMSEGAVHDSKAALSLPIARDSVLVADRAYPDTLRMVKVWDSINEKEITLVTNHMTWSPKTIAGLYKSRWDIEVFFKQIKQQL